MSEALTHRDGCLPARESTPFGLGRPADAVEGVVPRRHRRARVGRSGRQRARVGVARHVIACSCAGSGTKLGLGSGAAADRYPDVDGAAECGRRPSTWGFDGHDSGRRQAGRRQSERSRSTASGFRSIRPSADRATIGGLVATNDSGPRRHRYGAPRDLIIGVEFARADGRLAKGGGIVVKNVAGYDLPRLLTGSFGSLGVIVDGDIQAVSADRRHRGTLMVELSSPADLGDAGSEAVGQPSDADRARVCDPSDASDHQVRIDRGLGRATVRNRVEADRRERIRGATVSGSAEEAQFWQTTRASQTTDRCALVKVSVLPTELGRDADRHRAAGRQARLRQPRVAQVPACFCCASSRKSQLQKRVIDGLRDALQIGRGSAVIVKSPPELRPHVDVWGPIGDGLALMKAVKQQFDPVGDTESGERAWRSLN